MSFMQHCTDFFKLTIAKLFLAALFIEVAFWPHGVVLQQCVDTAGYSARGWLPWCSIVTRFLSSDIGATQVLAAVMLSYLVACIVVIAGNRLKRAG